MTFYYPTRVVCKLNQDSLEGETKLISIMNMTNVANAQKFAKVQVKIVERNI